MLADLSSNLSSTFDAVLHGIFLDCLAGIHLGVTGLPKVTSVSPV